MFQAHFPLLALAHVLLARSVRCSSLPLPRMMSMFLFRILLILQRWIMHLLYFWFDIIRIASSYQQYIFSYVNSFAGYYTTTQGASLATQCTTCISPVLSMINAASFVGPLLGPVMGVSGGSSNVISVGWVSALPNLNATISASFASVTSSRTV